MYQQQDPYAEIVNAFQQPEVMSPMRTIEGDEMTRAPEVGNVIAAPSESGGGGGMMDMFGGGGGMGGMMGGMGDIGASLEGPWDVYTNVDEEGDTSVDWDSVKLTGQILAMIFSDRRLKDNIKLVGNIDGVNMYSYNYIWDDVDRIGVMAQEVPHAAVLHPSGYLMVDIGKVFK